MDQENKNQTPQIAVAEVAVPAAPLTTVNPPKDKRRHFLAAFFISFLWGSFGIDRFYLGKIPTGILKLLTFGGFGIWTIVDLVLIMSGAMCDKEGNKLIDADRYKKLARNTVLVFALSCGVTLLFFGVGLITMTSQFLQNNNIQQYLTGGTNIQQLLNGEINQSSLDQLVGY